MNFTVRLYSAGEEKAKILIEGDLIVRDSAQIKEELLAIIHAYTEADIYLQNISRIDIAGLQLLLAFHKSAALANKSFHLFADSSADLQNTLKVSGYTHLIQIQ